MNEHKIAGVIDIGTNSIKLMIAEAGPHGITTLESLKNTTQLGRDTFFRNRITQSSINATVGILDKYREKLKEYAVTNVKVIATTAVREAGNSDVFVDTVLRRAGFTIEILTPGDVVYYIDAYLYHTLKDRYPLHDKNLLIAELGAGSLDVSLLARGYILMNAGLPLGTLRLRQLVNKLDGSRQENFEAAAEHIENQLAYFKRDMPPVTVDDIILIGEGYNPYLAEILTNKVLRGNFFRLTEEDTIELLDKCMDKPAGDLAADLKIPLEIADTLPAYAMVQSGLLNMAESKSVYILEASLAEAILADMLLDYEISKKYNKTNQLLSIAAAISQKYNVDMEHVTCVSKFAETLFESFREILGLKKSDSLYLLLAAYLHDIGMFLNNRAHHKHTEYVISNMNLFRLSQEEIKVIACVARYHRKGRPAKTHLTYGSLSAEKQMLVQKLSAILRIANCLDSSHNQKIRRIEVTTAPSRDITVTVHAEGNVMLEKLDFNEKKEIFEEISGNHITLKIIQL